MSCAKRVGPLVLLAVSAVMLALGGDWVGQQRGAVARAQPTAPVVGRTPGEPEYACRQPAIEIPQTPACRRGRDYPYCRWQIPSSPEGTYRIWRNTTPEHRWGRAGLVSLILASAAEHRRRWPEERVTIGDLDAPGPRHTTHDRGHDVDLYLENAMMARNERGGRYPDNYAGRPGDEVARLRARVLDFAKLLATCAHGEVRIYYNDPEIITPFRAWFEAQGLRSSVGEPMVAHNELHRFHFHLTIADSLEPLPVEEPSRDVD